MKEQFVTYEIALSLKELGYDEECLAAFNNGKICLLGEFKKINPMKWDAPAPLWQQCIDWFREKQKIHIIFSAGRDLGYSYRAVYLVHFHSIGNGFYKTYEEAREQVILQCIELLKER
jgi:hypothetical protein